ncbi:hypothetical protein BOX15_Mlig029417g1 [Macrostomum lignano]|uniref:RabBD domain-containing protein n=1 Tax=Macrostomum lignano TaxID=282301 RepID=A0A267DIX9_9PLAT|nr:hypothetical protein BOX15_Mlig029417g1 [Macrostomum lignano]
MAAQKELSDQRSAESVLVKIHFLTDQEKETVVEVLQRNEKIRKHEADRKRRLQQELERLESSCAASQSPLAALTQSCPRCDAALALLVRGACDCFLCRLSVCKSCAHLFRDSQLCLCSVCYQKLLYESKIGNWMNLKSVMIAAESSVAAAAEDRTADSGDLLSGLMVKLSGTSTGADKDAAAGDESSVSVGMAATPPAPTPVRQWEQPAATYRVYQVSTRRFADSPPPRQVEKDDEEATGAADEAESEAEEEQELSIEERMRRHLEGSPDIVQRLWEHQAKCEASLTSSNDTKNESAAVEEETIVCVTSERAHSEMPKRNENYSSDDEVELDQQGGEVIPADADDLTLVDEQAGQISHPTDMSEATGSQLGEAGAFSSADQNLETSELSSELTLTTSAEQRPTVPVCGSIQLTNKDFDSTEFFSDQAESTEPFDAEADKTFAVRDRQKNFETSSEELNFTDAPVEVTVVGEHRKTQITSGNSDYLSDMLSQSKNTEDIIVGPADRESLAAGKDQKKTTVETSQETMEGDYEVSFQRESSVTLVQDSDDRAETTEQVSQNLVSYEIEQVSGSEGQPAVELLVVDEKQSLYPLTSAPNVGSTPGTAHSMFFDSFKKANPRQDAQENQTLLCLEGGPSKQLPDAEIHDKVEEVRVSQEPVIEFNPSDSAENLATLEQSDKFEVKANRSEPTEKILVSRQQTKSSKTLDPQDRPQPEAIDFDIKLGLLKRRPAAVESQTEAELCATEPPAEVTVVDANLRTRIPEISFREASGNSDELSNVLNQCENSEEVVRGPSNKQNLAKNNRNGAGATDALDSSLQAIQGDYERPVHRFASVALAEDQEERPEILDEISHHLVPSSEIEQVSVADWRLKIEDGDRDDESRLEQLASALSVDNFADTSVHGNCCDSTENHLHCLECLLDCGDLPRQHAKTEYSNEVQEVLVCPESVSEIEPPDTVTGGEQPDLSAEQDVTFEKVQFRDEPTEPSTSEMRTGFVIEEPTDALEDTSVHGNCCDSKEKANQEALEDDHLHCLECLLDCGDLPIKHAKTEYSNEVQEVLVCPESVSEIEVPDTITAGKQPDLSAEQDVTFEKVQFSDEPTEPSTSEVRTGFVIEESNEPLDSDVDLKLLGGHRNAETPGVDQDIDEPQVEVTVVDARLKTLIPDSEFQAASENSDTLTDMLTQCEDATEVVHGPRDRQTPVNDKKLGGIDALDSSLQAIQGDYERPVHRDASVALAKDQEERPEILDEISHHLVPSNEIEQVSVAKDEGQLKIEDGDRDDESRLEQLASALSVDNFADTSVHGNCCDSKEKANQEALENDHLHCLECLLDCGDLRSKHAKIEDSNEVQEVLVCPETVSEIEPVGKKPDLNAEQDVTFEKVQFKDEPTEPSTIEIRTGLVLEESTDALEDPSVHGNFCDSTDTEKANQEAPDDEHLHCLECLLDCGDLPRQHAKAEESNEVQEVLVCPETVSEIELAGEQPDLSAEQDVTFEKVQFRDKPTEPSTSEVKTESVIEETTDTFADTSVHGNFYDSNGTEKANQEAPDDEHLHCLECLLDCGDLPRQHAKAEESNEVQEVLVCPESVSEIELAGEQPDFSAEQDVTFEKVQFKDEPTEPSTSEVRTGFVLEESTGTFADTSVRENCSDSKEKASQEALKDDHLHCLECLLDCGDLPIQCLHDDRKTEIKEEEFNDRVLINNPRTLQRNEAENEFGIQTEVSVESVVSFLDADDFTMEQRRSASDKEHLKVSAGQTEVTPEAEETLDSVVSLLATEDLLLEKADDQLPEVVDGVEVSVPKKEPVNRSADGKESLQVDEIVCLLDHNDLSTQHGDDQICSLKHTTLKPSDSDFMIEKSLDIAQQTIESENYKQEMVESVETSQPLSDTTDSKIRYSASVDMEANFVAGKSEAVSVPTPEGNVSEASLNLGSRADRQELIKLSSNDLESLFEIASDFDIRHIRSRLSPIEEFDSRVAVEEERVDCTFSNESNNRKTFVELPCNYTGSAEALTSVLLDTLNCEQEVEHPESSSYSSSRTTGQHAETLAKLAESLEATETVDDTPVNVGSCAVFSTRDETSKALDKVLDSMQSLLPEEDTEEVAAPAGSYLVDNPDPDAAAQLLSNLADAMDDSSEKPVPPDRALCKCDSGRFVLEEAAAQLESFLDDSDIVLPSKSSDALVDPVFDEEQVQPPQGAADGAPPAFDLGHRSPEDRSPPEPMGVVGQFEPPSLTTLPDFGLDEDIETRDESKVKEEDQTKDRLQEAAELPGAVQGSSDYEAEKAGESGAASPEQSSGCIDLATTGQASPAVPPEFVIVADSEGPSTAKGEAAAVQLGMQLGIGDPDATTSGRRSPMWMPPQPPRSPTAMSRLELELLDRSVFFPRVRSAEDVGSSSDSAGQQEEVSKDSDGDDDDSWVDPHEYRPSKRSHYNPIVPRLDLGDLSRSLSCEANIDSAGSDEPATPMAPRAPPAAVRELAAAAAAAAAARTPRVPPQRQASQPHPILHQNPRNLEQQQQQQQQQKPPMSAPPGPKFGGYGAPNWGNVIQELKGKPRPEPVRAYQPTWSSGEPTKRTSAFASQGRQQIETAISQLRPRPSSLHVAQRVGQPLQQQQRTLSPGPQSSQLQDLLPPPTLPKPKCPTRPHPMAAASKSRQALPEVMSEAPTESGAIVQMRQQRSDSSRDEPDQIAEKPVGDSENQPAEADQPQLQDVQERAKVLEAEQSGITEREASQSDENKSAVSAGELSLVSQPATTDAELAVIQASAVSNELPSITAEPEATGKMQELVSAAPAAEVSSDLPVSVALSEGAATSTHGIEPQAAADCAATAEEGRQRPRRSCRPSQSCSRWSRRRPKRSQTRWPAEGSSRNPRRRNSSNGWTRRRDCLRRSW